MLGEADVFAFTLAERLGMTVAELNFSISPAEYREWVAFYTWRNAMQDLEMAAARGH